MTELPGVGKLIDHYEGTPPTLRWLSIHADGRVIEHQSDNQIAWSTAYQMWVQWRLVRDVYHEVDPTNHGFSLIPASRIQTPHGMVITVWRDDGPANPVATTMLAALGIHRDIHDTVAWLADADSQTELHGDLDDRTRAQVLALAAQHGATVPPEAAGS